MNSMPLALIRAVSSRINPKNTGLVLTKVGLDAAVVGSIDAKDQTQVRTDDLTKVNTSLTVVFKDGTFCKSPARSFLVR